MNVIQIPAVVSCRQSGPELLWMRRLIWAYFVLLIFEGVLRKWLLPALADPLLIVRDPVVILIYLIALRARIYPRNYFLLFGGWLAFLTFVAGVIAPTGTVVVAIYGWRANFLHLPLIFLIPRVWSSQDVQAVGRWTLLLAPAMAFLMVLQFRASPDDWLNTGAGGTGGQIVSAMDRIRPAGTFSFITGPVFFFSIVAAFLFHGQLTSRQYPPWLQGVAFFSLVSATVVSGSRSFLGNVAVVALCAFLAGVVLRPFLVFRWLWMASLAGVATIGISELAFVQEGVEVLNARIEAASSIEGGSAGFANRAAGGFTWALPLLLEAPLLGHGLGLGTNAGAALITGKAEFLLAEAEWQRVILESGPLLGGAFLIWRVCLALRLGWDAAAQAKAGNPLPILLFGVGGLALANGQFGQPTTLGFAVLSGGLCLAAMRKDAHSAIRPLSPRVPALPVGPLNRVPPTVERG